MNLTLKVTPKESTNMSSLVKQMCSLKCRIKVNSVNGDISIVDMDDTNVESVIDAINEAFDITGIDIIPTVVPPEPEKPVITEDSIEFEKVEFNNAEVQEQVNKLLRIIYWAMYSSKANSRDICQYLMTTGTEIAMKYNPKAPSKFAIGDIVDCNYGSHLKNEISGGHVHSVICDIEDNGLVYAVPITKASLEGDATKYLQFSVNVDVEYNDSRFTGGTVLLKMGRYIHHLRISEVVGHALPEFFEKLLTALPTTVDFSAKYRNYETELAEKLGNVQNDDSMLSFESSEGQKGTETTSKGEEETSTPHSSSEDEDYGKPSNNTKKPSAEDYVANLIANSLANLDKSKPILDQIDIFLDSIGFPTSERIIKQSFVAACEVKKVGYESILLELHSIFPKVREDIIKATIKEEFKKWLVNHPEAKEKYPKISFMVLLKVFAKKMR